MAVPTQLSDLSATAASNSPAGGDTVGTTMDDYLRAIQSIIVRISAGTDAMATPALGAPTAAGRISANLGLTVAGGTFVSRGITDSATAAALTLSGSGANSVTIANSATTPTIGTSTGSLALVPANGVADVGNGTTAETLNLLGTGSGIGGGARIQLSLGGSVTIALGNKSALIGGAYDNVGLLTSYYDLAIAALGADQVRITGTASADRYITMTGSNGGNPTIGTSAGSLALSVAVVAASTVTVGSNLFANGYAQVNSDDATPAGGATNTGLFLGVSAIGIYFGSGAPTVSAAQGSLYIRTDGGASTRLYSNNNGTTGWSAITSA